MRLFFVAMAWFILSCSLVRGQSTRRTADPLRRNPILSRDSKGQLRPIIRPADWETRRRGILDAMQQVMGSVPRQWAKLPLEVEVLATTELPQYIRKKIRFRVEPDDRLSAWLLIPRHIRGHEPAMVCLHQTIDVGKDSPVGLSDKPELHYAAELAERGYVTISPDYWDFGDYRNTKYDPYAHGYQSGTMKGVWNHMRCVDLLQSLPQVDPERIGAIGHSLGGHNALFLAAFDPRIKAVVSSCGFGSFRSYAESPYGGGDLRNWAQRRYMPRIAEVYGNDPKRVPFDWPEVLAAIAPRPLFINATLQDQNFLIDGVQESIAAAQPVYRLLQAEANLQGIHPDAPHAFPKEARDASYLFLDRALVPADNRPIDYISTGFENASPLQWSIDAAGTIHIYMMYDYERDSSNRAAGHWHFQIQGKAGTDVTLILHNFDNIWNGRAGLPISDKSICFISPDGKQWEAIPTQLIEGGCLRIRVHLDGESLYLARLEPYRISDLNRLLDEIRGNKLVEITEIGETVEGRPLEIMRLGNPDAPKRILLRARCHSWEPGGNWIVQGLIRSLLRDNDVSRQFLKSCCLYVMPMANKDGVARGLTRFNMQGRDLNRNWDKPSDAKLAPENFALERWIKSMAQKGRPISFAMDLHNDEGGSLHISRPPIKDLDRHLARMKLFEQLLRKHTWFTVGSTPPGVRNEGTFGEGLLERYGIDACILEFNCNWIEGLKQYPSGKAWEQFGDGLRQVFIDYFANAQAK